MLGTIHGVTLFFSKTSLLLLYYRIFSPDKYFRYKLYWACGIIAVFTLSSIPINFAFCHPRGDGSWAQTEGEFEKVCYNASWYGFVLGLSVVIFDLFLIYLPASVIIHLQMPLRRKIGILSVFMTGML